MDRDDKYLLNKLVDLTWEISVEVLDIYENSFDVMIKDDKSPLTQADIVSHQKIMDALQTLTPDIPIISEEDAQGHSWSPELSLFWLVDPIDGTREFINHNGEFTVNIALIDKGHPVLGIVGAPALGVCYAGIVGQGAFKIQSESRTVRESIHVASRSVVEKQPLKVVGSRSHNDSSTMNTYLSHIGDYDFIPAGSSLKFCLIAEGKAHLYPRLGRTMEWDTAAGQAVLEAAGGSVTTLDGLPFTYGKAGFENPHFVAQAFSINSLNND